MNTHFNPLILLVAPVDAVLPICTLPHHTKGNDMTNDAHSNEYLAAIAGMADHTMPPAPQPPAIGDFVSGITAGKRWSGRVEIVEGNRMTLDVGGGWVAVPVSDITH
jgi:hypothetical protein